MIASSCCIIIIKNLLYHVEINFITAYVLLVILVINYE